MYFLVREGLGEPARDVVPRTLAMRPRPFLKLDNFVFDRHWLTPDLLDKVRRLGDAVIQSWNSAQPIETVRLIGHTDSTGPEKYNFGLGDKRAQTVAAALQEKLKGLSGRVSIVVGKSPGELEPAADNATKQGQALNRRVEVFVTVRPAPPPPPPGKPIDWTVHLPPESVIVTHLSERDKALMQPPPTRPAGQSFKSWLDDILARAHIPKFARDKIWTAIFDKNWGLLSTLLSAAGFGDATRNAIVESARAVAEGKVR